MEGKYYLTQVAVGLLICFSAVSAQGEGSCVGRCGEGYFRGHSCHCDYNCMSYMECCRDFKAVCTTENSCRGRCHEGFIRGQACDCDPNCINYGKCCPDYESICAKPIQRRSPAPRPPEERGNPPDSSKKKDSEKELDKVPQESDTDQRNGDLPRKVPKKPSKNKIGDKIDGSDQQPKDILKKRNPKKERTMENEDLKGRKLSFPKNPKKTRKKKVIVAEEETDLKMNNSSSKPSPKKSVKKYPKNPRKKKNKKTLIPKEDTEDADKKAPSSSSLKPSSRKKNKKRKLKITTVKPAKRRRKIIIQYEDEPEEPEQDTATSPPNVITPQPVKEKKQPPKKPKIPKKKPKKLVETEEEIEETEENETLSMFSTTRKKGTTIKRSRTDPKKKKPKDKNLNPKANATEPNKESITPSLLPPPDNNENALMTPQVPSVGDNTEDPNGSQEDITDNSPSSTTPKTTKKRSPPKTNKKEINKEQDKDEPKKQSNKKKTPKKPSPKDIRRKEKTDPKGEKKAPSRGPPDTSDIKNIKKPVSRGPKKRIIKVLVEDDTEEPSKPVNKKKPSDKPSTKDINRKKNVDSKGERQETVESEFTSSSQSSSSRHRSKSTSRRLSENNKDNKNKNKKKISDENPLMPPKRKKGKDFLRTPEQTPRDEGSGDDGSGMEFLQKTPSTTSLPSSLPKETFYSTETPKPLSTDEHSLKTTPVMNIFTDLSSTSTDKMKEPFKQTENPAQPTEDSTSKTTANNENNVETSIALTSRQVNEIITDPSQNVGSISKQPQIKTSNDAVTSIYRNIDKTTLAHPNNSLTDEERAGNQKENTGDSRITIENSTIINWTPYTTQPIRTEEMDKNTPLFKEANKDGLLIYPTVSSQNMENFTLLPTEIKIQQAIASTEGSINDGLTNTHFESKNSSFSAETVFTDIPKSTLTTLRMGPSMSHPETSNISRGISTTDSTLTRVTDNVSGFVLPSEPDGNNPPMVSRDYTDINRTTTVVLTSTYNSIEQRYDHNFSVHTEQLYTTNVLNIKTTEITQSGQTSPTNEVPKTAVQETTQVPADSSAFVTGENSPYHLVGSSLPTVDAPQSLSPVQQNSTHKSQSSSMNRGLNEELASTVAKQTSEISTGEIVTTGYIDDIHSNVPTQSSHSSSNLYIIEQTTSTTEYSSNIYKSTTVKENESRLAVTQIPQTGDLSNHKILDTTPNIHTINRHTVESKVDVFTEHSTDPNIVTEGIKSTGGQENPRAINKTPDERSFISITEASQIPLKITTVDSTAPFRASNSPVQSPAASFSSEVSEKPRLISETYVHTEINSTGTTGTPPVDVKTETSTKPISVVSTATLKPIDQVSGTLSPTDFSQKSFTTFPGDSVHTEQSYATNVLNIKSTKAVPNERITEGMVSVKTLDKTLVEPTQGPLSTILNKDIDIGYTNLLHTKGSEAPTDVSTMITQELNTNNILSPTVTVNLGHKTSINEATSEQEIVNTPETKQSPTYMPKTVQNERNNERMVSAKTLDKAFVEPTQWQHTDQSSKAPQPVELNEELIQSTTYDTIADHAVSVKDIGSAASHSTSSANTVTSDTNILDAIILSTLSSDKTTQTEMQKASITGTTQLPINLVGSSLPTVDAPQYLSPAQENSTHKSQSSKEAPLSTVLNKDIDIGYTNLLHTKGSEAPTDASTMITQELNTNNILSPKVTVNLGHKTSINEATSEQEIVNTPETKQSLTDMTKTVKNESNTEGMVSAKTLDKAFVEPTQWQHTDQSKAPQPVELNEELIQSTTYDTIADHAVSVKDIGSAASHSTSSANTVTSDTNTLGAIILSTLSSDKTTQTEMQKASIPGTTQLPIDLVGSSLPTVDAPQFLSIINQTASTTEHSSNIYKSTPVKENESRPAVTQTPQKDHSEITVSATDTRTEFIYSQTFTQSTEQSTLTKEAPLSTVLPIGLNKDIDIGYTNLLDKNGSEAPTDASSMITQKLNTGTVNPIHKTSINEATSEQDIVHSPETKQSLTDMPKTVLNERITEGMISVKTLDTTFVEPTQWQHTNQSSNAPQPVESKEELIQSPTSDTIADHAVSIKDIGSAASHPTSSANTVTSDPNTLGAIILSTLPSDKTTQTEMQKASKTGTTQLPVDTSLSVTVGSKTGDLSSHKILDTTLNIHTLNQHTGDSKVDIFTEHSTDPNIVTEGTTSTGGQENTSAVTKTPDERPVISITEASQIPLKITVTVDSTAPFRASTSPVMTIKQFMVTTEEQKIEQSPAASFSSEVSEKPRSFSETDVHTEINSTELATIDTNDLNTIISEVVTEGALTNNFRLTMSVPETTENHPVDVKTSTKPISAVSTATLKPIDAQSADQASGTSFPTDFSQKSFTTFAGDGISGTSPIILTGETNKNINKLSETVPNLGTIHDFEEHFETVTHVDRTQNTGKTQNTSDEKSLNRSASQENLSTLAGAGTDKTNSDVSSSDTYSPASSTTGTLSNQSSFVTAYKNTDQKRPETSTVTAKEDHIMTSSTVKYVPTILDKTSEKSVLLTTGLVETTKGNIMASVFTEGKEGKSASPTIGTSKVYTSSLKADLETSTENIKESTMHSLSPQYSLSTGKRDENARDTTVYTISTSIFRNEFTTLEPKKMDVITTIASTESYPPSSMQKETDHPPNTPILTDVSSVPISTLYKLLTKYESLVTQPADLGSKHAGVSDITFGPGVPFTDISATQATDLTRLSSHYTINTPESTTETIPKLSSGTMEVNTSLEDTFSKSNNNLFTPSFGFSVNTLTSLQEQSIPDNKTNDNSHTTSSEGLQTITRSMLNSSTSIDHKNEPSSSTVRNINDTLNQTSTVEYSTLKPSEQKNYSSGQSTLFVTTQTIVSVTSSNTVESKENSTSTEGTRGYSSPTPGQKIEDSPTTKPQLTSYYVNTSDNRTFVDIKETTTSSTTQPMKSVSTTKQLNIASLQSTVKSSEKQENTTKEVITTKPLITEQQTKSPSVSLFPKSTAKYDMEQRFTVTKSDNRNTSSKGIISVEQMENKYNANPPLSLNQYSICEMLLDKENKLGISESDLQRVREICMEIHSNFTSVSTPSSETKLPLQNPSDSPPKQLTTQSKVVQPKEKLLPGPTIIQLVEEISRKHLPPERNVTLFPPHKTNKLEAWILLLKKIRSPHDPQMNLCNGQPVNGMTTLQNGSMVVFRGHYFWMLNQGGAVRQARKISDVWGIPSPVDTVFTRCNCAGKTFFIKGPQYWRFTNDVMDKGYPKDISKGFGGLQGKITAVLSVAGFKTRPESVYFFKGGGNVQKYTFQQEQSKRCTKKKQPTVQYPIYSNNIQTVKYRYPRDIVQKKIQRTRITIKQEPLGVLHQEISIRSTWRGIPNSIVSAISLPNSQKLDGFDYFVFSKEKYYNINITSKVAVKPPPNSEQKTSKDWYKCKD